MKTTSAVRRGLYGVFAACLSGGAAAAVMAGPSAVAANDPCAASEIARTIGSVATNTGTYLVRAVPGSCQPPSPTSSAENVRNSCAAWPRPASRSMSWRRHSGLDERPHTATSLTQVK